jgi:hypothetical protein
MRKAGWIEWLARIVFALCILAMLGLLVLVVLGRW